MSRVIAPRVDRVRVLLQRTLWRFATLAAVAALVGCDDFHFAGSVVGGDASDDGVALLDLGDLDAPDGDAPDARPADADVTAPVDLPEGGCTPDDDRCPRGRYCNAVTRSCADGCRRDDDCALPASGDAGAGALRYCDVGRRVCVQCRRDAECAAGQYCAGGVCEVSCSPTIPCPAGRTCCGGACVDTLTNRGHCGACGAACALANAAPACRDGRCAVGTCMDPYGDCDGLVSNGCETDLRGVNNCGACDRACPVRPGATTACDPAARACVTRCNGGFEDCNLNPLDGCEASPATDVRHCGGCGRECRLANATSACADGRCAVAACAPGWGDCDGNPANGCEVGLDASIAHCGMCGRVCPARPGATPSCAAGACRSACAPDRGDCNGRAEDGCETETRVDLLHCGGCGLVCRPANATGQCLSGSCEIAACDRGFLDCDGSAVNGCEADLATSPRNCGACGRACAAGQACALGACVADCGSLTRCGSSCTDLRADDRNCGACGRACGADEACAGGACAPACRPPQALCSGRCVLTASDRSNCGACGRACPAAANATPTCTAGACGFACLAGFSDCDGVAANGCEVSTVNDARNCGGCNAVCTFPGAAATCSASRCVLGACGAGAGNCDGVASNGCEVALASDPRHCGRCNNACAGACAAGACATAVTVDRPTVINTAAASVNAARGAREASVLGVTGLVIPVGARVVLHQTQGTAATAGLYEFNTVTAVAGGNVQLATPLRNAYSTAGAARAQLVVVQVYNDLIVRPAGSLTAPEWNGSTGGLLAIEATGAVLVEGAIRMNGRGFHGPSRGCAAPGGSNRCRYGQQGESWSGIGATGPASNAGGGGGGGQGEDCGSGGGGAYGVGAGAGSPGDCGRAGATSGVCALRCPNEGGASGAAYGTGSLSGTIHLGSGGGEGGMDDDGGLPGAGGNGGGVILLRAGGNVVVRGAVTASGTDGLNGDQFACGGVGCGMGGGGGGAGGGVWIAAPNVTLGASLVTATGGNGGQCSCRIVDVRRAAPAGRGGNGRVTVVAPVASGATTPPYDPS
jgi:Cys-rich repeat protein